MAWPTPVGGFPWTILAVNSAGAFLLAALLGVVLAAGNGAGSAPRYVVLLGGTGFLGAFTTFAAVMVSAQQLAGHSRLAAAGLYLSSTLATGLLAGWAGLKLGRAVSSGSPPEAPGGGPPR